MKNVYLAIKRLAETNSTKRFVFPMHLNPNARRPAEEILGGLGNVHLIDPLDYRDFVYMLALSVLVITDSGNSGRGTLVRNSCAVTRNSTERPEGIDAGVATLVGTDPETIFRGGK